MGGFGASGVWDVWGFGVWGFGLLGGLGFGCLGVWGFRGLGGLGFGRFWVLGFGSKLPLPPRIGWGLADLGLSAFGIWGAAEVKCASTRPSP